MATRVAVDRTTAAAVTLQNLHFILLQTLRPQNNDNAIETMLGRSQEGRRRGVRGGM